MQCVNMFCCHDNGSDELHMCAKLNFHINCNYVASGQLLPLACVVVMETIVVGYEYALLIELMQLQIN